MTTILGRKIKIKNLTDSESGKKLYYLKNSRVKPGFNAPGLSDAKSRRAYDRHVDYRRSENSTIYTAKLEGRLEGKAEGKLEGKVEGMQEVFALLEQGFSLSEAKKKLGLT